MVPKQVVLSHCVSSREATSHRKLTSYRIAHGALLGSQSTSAFQHPGSLRFKPQASCMHALGRSRGTPASTVQCRYRTVRTVPYQSGYQPVANVLWRSPGGQVSYSTQMLCQLAGWYNLTVLFFFFQTISQIKSYPRPAPWVPGSNFYSSVRMKKARQGAVV